MFPYRGNLQTIILAQHIYETTGRASDVYGRVRSRYTYRLISAIVVATGVIVGFALVFTMYADFGVATDRSALSGTMVTLGVLAVVLGGNVATALGRLQSAASAIEARNFEQTPTRRRADEIGELATALASMGETLEEAFEESEAARADAQAAKADAERLTDELLMDAETIGTAMDAAAAGDFTHRLETDSNVAAIEQISDRYAQMTTELSDTVEDLREFAASVETATREAAQQADRAATSHEQLAEESRSITETVSQRADRLESVAEDVADVSATIEEIAATTDDTATEAAEGARVGSRGVDQAQAAREAMQTVDETTAEVAQLVDTLNSRMAAVTETTDLIEEIAEQTDMLALNANIEAARVTDGDGGEGFAVVADEVKQLAEETQTAVEEIDATVTQTQGDVERVTTEMATARERIDDGTDQLSAATTTVEQLTTIVTEVDGATDEISRATDDGAASAQQVSTAVTSIADDVRSVAQQCETLATTAADTAETMAALRDRSNDLVDRAGRLRESLETFRLHQQADTPNGVQSHHQPTGVEADDD